MKFPGTYYAYALILAIFGESPLGIHAGLLIVNAATTFLVFTIGRRLAGDAFGAFAAVSFAVSRSTVLCLGVFAHATHFVLVPALGALLLLTGIARRAGCVTFSGAASCWASRSS